MAAVPVSFFKTHRASHQATKSEPMEKIRTRGRALSYDIVTPLILAGIRTPRISDNFGFWIWDFGLREPGLPRQSKIQNPKSKISYWMGTVSSTIPRFFAPELRTMSMTLMTSP